MFPRLATDSLWSSKMTLNVSSSCSYFPGGGTSQASATCLMYVMRGGGGGQGLNSGLHAWQQALFELS